MDIVTPTSGDVFPSANDTFVTLSYLNCPVCSHTTPRGGFCAHCQPGPAICLACWYRGPRPVEVVPPEPVA